MPEDYFERMKRARISEVEIEAAFEWVTEIREVVEEGERRLGGGPGAMEGGLPWGEQPYSFNGLLCLSYKLAENFLSSSYTQIYACLQHT